MQDVADQTAPAARGPDGVRRQRPGRPQVTYLDADGHHAPALVSGVTFGADGPVLDVDGDDVPLGQVASHVTVGRPRPPTDHRTTQPTTT